MKTKDEGETIQDDIPSKPKMSSNRAVRALWIIAGTISLGLGIIGIPLPVLPTTPFLLLAAACYVRGSERMYNWLMRNKWFGKYIRDYREKGGIPLKIKVGAISFLWIAIGITTYFFIQIIWIRIILIAIAASVTYHILSFKTL